MWSLSLSVFLTDHLSVCSPVPLSLPIHRALMTDLPNMAGMTIPNIQRKALRFQVSNIAKLVSNKDSTLKAPPPPHPAFPGGVSCVSGRLTLWSGT